ncbi:MAG: MFS transporter [Pseudomonadota bacterium]
MVDAANLRADASAPGYARFARNPFWLLVVMAASMQFIFGGWNVLSKNFAVDVLEFTGLEVGIQEAVREIPGFLSFLVIFLILFIREQRLALVSLVLLAFGTLITGVLPSFTGFLVTTTIMSIGFHYYEACQQSLALQWLPKSIAPTLMGRIISYGAMAQLSAFAMVLALGWALDLGFAFLFAIIGGFGLLVVLWAMRTFPMFEQPVAQNKRIVLRKRYWLYYALVFMGGARRQIFIVFAALLLIERYGVTLETIAGLFLVNGIVSMLLAPLIGRFITAVGERRALIVEYVGLMVVFTGYGFAAAPEWFGADPLRGTLSVWVAAGAALYVLDHAFFAMAIAQKTYFQKIADPADMAPTAATAFTINHIAAVTMPFFFGLLWLYSPAAVFLSGSVMAFVSLCLSLMVPRNPRPGHETRSMFGALLGGGSEGRAAAAAGSAS